jgi:hypothetical protein
MTGATRRMACQRKASIRCGGGRNFHDCHNFHVFPITKEESLSFVGGLGDMEVMVVMEDRSVSDLSLRSLTRHKLTQAASSATLGLAARRLRRSMTAGW